MIVDAAGSPPVLGNMYVVLWSLINFLLLALLIAVPIVCIVMLVKMNRRLKRMEAEMQKLVESNNSEES